MVTNIRTVWSTISSSSSILVVYTKENKYIQDNLTKDMHQKFDRQEGILIKLIDQQKKMQIEQKGLERSYRTLVEIIAKLSGNGLKHKFMNMLNNDNK